MSDQATSGTDDPYPPEDSLGLDVMVRTAVVDHLETALRELVEAVRQGERRDARSWRETAVRGVHTAVAAAREGLVPLDAETVGRLLFTLTDVPVRDAACGFPSSGADDPVEGLWLDVAMRAPAAWGAAPAAVLAYLRWCRGDHSGAERAATIAVNLDPDESLAPLVVSAAVHRLSPDGSTSGGGRSEHGSAQRVPRRPVRRGRRTAARRQRKAS